MSTLSTASTYINKINESYPVAGQDNSTQGFRDNFKNIKLSLQSSDEEITDLKLNSVTLTNPVNDFNHNTLKRVSLKESSQIVYDNSSVTQTGDVVLDYRNGSYQKFKISSGIHWFDISNWPGNGKAASILLSITTSTTATTTVNFNATNVYNFGKNKFPITLIGENPHLFELTNDGSDGNLIVKEYRDTNYVNVNDQSSVIRTDDVVLDYRNGSYQKFTISTGTHVFSVSNWPGNGKSGSILLSISTSTTTSTSATIVSFTATNVYNFGRNKFPITLNGTNPYLFELTNDGVDGNLIVKEYRDSNSFTSPIRLASYTTSTLGTISTASNGDMIFLTSGYNRPAYYSNGSWFIMTGTSITL